MRIRPANPADHEFIQHLAPRLVEFGVVPGRERAHMIARDREVLAKSLDAASREAEVFVAEDDQGVRAGFIHLTLATDYYSNSNTAHIADLVVAEEAERRGVGSALIDFAEEWARGRGSALLTLSVFTANHGARQLYRRLGFQEEWIRCIKRIR